MKIDKLDLLSKGWSVSEIEKTSKIIDDAEKKSHVSTQFFNKSIFWILLVLLSIFNIVSSIVILPLLFAIRNYAVDLLVAIIGFIFGILFTILISDIERLDYKHHNTLLIVVIFTAIINFSLIINYVKDYTAKSGLKLVQNPILIAGIYLVAFLIPYIVFLIRKNQKK